MVRSVLPARMENLSVAERILLVEEIWDSIAAEQHSVEVTDAQRDELGRRMDAYQQSPDQGSHWEDARRRITER